MALSSPPESEITYTGHDLGDYRLALGKLLESRPELAPTYGKIDCFITYLAYPKTFETDLTKPTRVLDILGKRYAS